LPPFPEKRNVPMIISIMLDNPAQSFAGKIGQAL
jgi:hypothetical protein